MKKTLIVALMMLAGVAQAKEINLICSEKEISHKVSINTDTSKGMLNTTPTEVRSNDTEYASFGKQPNMNIEFRVNRETLNATIVRTWTESLAMLKPSTSTGTCSIAPARTNLI